MRELRSEEGGREGGREGGSLMYVEDDESQNA